MLWQKLVCTPFNSRIPLIIQLLQNYTLQWDPSTLGKYRFWRIHTCVYKKKLIVEAFCTSIESGRSQWTGKTKNPPGTYSFFHISFVVIGFLCSMTLVEYFLPRISVCSIAVYVCTRMYLYREIFTIAIRQ